LIVDSAIIEEPRQVNSLIGPRSSPAKAAHRPKGTELNLIDELLQFRWK